MPARSVALWGAGLVSAAVLGLFGTVVVLMFLKGAPPDNATLNQIIGGLVQLAGLVVGFWVGSSAGSMMKTLVESENRRDRDHDAT